MIDWSRIEQLREDIGEDDFDEVVEIFIDEVESVIDRLRDAASAEQLAAELHCLKGSASNLGFATFAQACAAAEAHARKSEIDRVDTGQILRTYEMSKASFIDGLAANAT